MMSCKDVVCMYSRFLRIEASIVIKQNSFTSQDILTDPRNCFSMKAQH